MSVALTIAGVTYNYPTTSDNNWGDDATNWAVAVSTQLLQRTGGAFNLTNDVNFGGSFGLISIYYKSRSSNIASTGILRLAVGDQICFRNNANNGNIVLSVDGSDNFCINGTPVLVTPGGILGPADGGTGISSYTSGDMIYASGTTTLSKLAIGSANKIMLSTGSAPSWATTVPKVAGGTGADNSSVTFPSSGVLVTEAGSETLTNKTLTSPTINTPTIATPTVNGIKNAVVGTKTANYTATATDYLIPCDASGGAFTIALPAVASSSGQTYVIRKIDSSFTAVTIDPNASETIDGATTTTLNTQWEAVTIVCDGTTWQIADRKIFGGPTSYTPTFVAFGTVTSISFQWWRIGTFLKIIGVYTTGTATGSTATLTLPSGLTSQASIVAYSPVGNVLSSATGAAALYLMAAPSSNTINYGIQSGSSNAETPAVGTAIGSNNQMAVEMFVPIAGWNG